MPVPGAPQRARLQAPSPNSSGPSTFGTNADAADPAAPSHAGVIYIRIDRDLTASVCCENTHAAPPPESFVISYVPGYGQWVMAEVGLDEARARLGAGALEGAVLTLPDPDRKVVLFFEAGRRECGDAKEGGSRFFECTETGRLEMVTKMEVVEGRAFWGVGKPTLVRYLNESSLDRIVVMRSGLAVDRVSAEDLSITEVLTPGNRAASRLKCMQTLPSLSTTSSGTDGDWENTTPSNPSTPTDREAFPRNKALRNRSFSSGALSTLNRSTRNQRRTRPITLIRRASDTFALPPSALRGPNSVRPAGKVRFVEEDPDRPPSPQPLPRPRSAATGRQEANKVLRADLPTHPPLRRNISAPISSAPTTKSSPPLLLSPAESDSSGFTDIVEAVDFGLRPVPVVPDVPISSSATVPPIRTPRRADSIAIESLSPGAPLTHRRVLASRYRGRYSNKRTRHTIPPGRQSPDILQRGFEVSDTPNSPIEIEEGMPFIIPAEKRTFEERVWHIRYGSPKDWYRWPPVQIAAEMVPERMKWIDWRGEPVETYWANVGSLTSLGPGLGEFTSTF